MDDFFKKLHSVMKSVNLSSDRKEAMRSRLMIVMHAQKAVREAEKTRQHIRRSLFGSYFKLMPITSIIALVVLVGGGTSFAAEGTLPGDLLYPVKVTVNEEVRAALSLSAESKADWEAERAVRRLEEATQLAVSGNVNADVQADLESRFEAHVEKAEAHIQTVEDDGDLETASDLAAKFEASLEAHGEILNTIQETRLEVAEKMAPIQAAVHAKIDSARDVSLKIDAKIRTEQVPSVSKRAAEQKVRAAQKAVRDVRNQITRDQSKMSASSTTEASVKIHDAEAMALEAQATLEAEVYGEAFDLGKEALRLAQEAKTFARAEARLRKVGVVLQRNEVAISMRAPEEHNEDGSRGTQRGKEEEDDRTKDDRDRDKKKDVGVRSGIRGTIVLGPQCPVVQLGVDDCDDTPYRATIVVKTEGETREVTRVTAEGKFSVVLAPGTYVLVPVQGNALFPRAASQTVDVQENAFTEVTIIFDTGIRVPALPVPPVTSSSTTISFTRVYIGDYGNREERGNHIIRSRDAWERVMGDDVEATIDFEHEMALAVFMGQKGSGGYSIQIEKIVKTDANMKVYVKEVSPGPLCAVTAAITAPYEVVKLPATDAKIEFVTEREITTCVGL